MGESQSSSIGPPPVKPAPTCVVGMHRSGTSLTTRMLEALGVDLGPRDSFVPADPIDNRDGYQEQAPIVELNDELLRALGGHASEPPELAPGWEQRSELLPLVERARALIAQLFGSAPWAFKDPRASLLLPFWRLVEPELRVLICIRNPLEVALSMSRRRDPYELQHWSHMWKRHTERALGDSKDCERAIVIFEDLTGDPEICARRLGHFVGVDEQDASLIAAAAAMPDLGSRRTVIDDRTLIADLRVPRSIAHEYIELRDRVRRMNTGKSSDVGSIDSRASNPITTQPLAALLVSRHGS